jgi:hypothetical protein
VKRPSEGIYEKQRRKRVYIDTKGALMERQRIMQKVLSRDNLAQMETLMYDEKLN